MELIFFYLYPQLTRVSPSGNFYIICSIFLMPSFCPFYYVVHYLIYKVVQI